MNGGGMKKTLLVIGVLAFLFAGLALSARQGRLTRVANERMDTLVQIAKYQTSDVCDPTMFEVVIPPEHSDRKPVFVIAGKEDYPGQRNIWRFYPVIRPRTLGLLSDAFARANEDSVKEVWVGRGEYDLFVKKQVGSAYCRWLEARVVG
jgi:hypothetical protein